MSRTMIESKALSEVRQWKAECNGEVAGMEIGAAIRKRLKDSADNARKAGFVPLVQRADRVAEAGCAYAVGRDQNPD